MIQITDAQLRYIALGVVSDSQMACDTKENDDNSLLYTVAFNDGVLTLLNAILERIGEIK